MKEEMENEIQQMTSEENNRIICVERMYAKKLELLSKSNDANLPQHSQKNHVLQRFTNLENILKGK